jgi:hypothetical protein
MARNPVLPLSLFRMHAFGTAACAGLLVNLVFFVQWP